MKLLIVITSILGLSLAQFKVSCECGTKNAKRIIEGNEAVPYEYPWVVSLLDSTSFIPFCGGTIITAWHVLTSAVCTVDKNNLDLILCIGTHDVTVCMDEKYKPIKERIIDVFEIKIHDKFNRDKKINDISLLVTTTEILFNQKVAAACFPSVKFEGRLEDETFKALGWGNNNRFNELREVDLTVFSNQECKEKYHRNMEKPKQICTVSNTGRICFGDFGGPLMWLDPDINRYIVTGVMSYAEKSCKNRDVPSVSTNLFEYSDWIFEQIRGGAKNWYWSGPTREGKICRKVENPSF